MHNSFSEKAAQGAFQTPNEIHVHVQNFFFGGASRVPSLQATLPPSPQIFSVISDTSCHTPYLFFKNTNCVTPSPNNLC